MKRLLVVVDMQNDFIDGALGTEEAQAIVGRVEEKIRAYEADREGEVVFTLDTHFENYLETLEGKKLPVPHCVKDTNGWKLHSSLEQYPGKRYEKSTFGCVSMARDLEKCEFESIEVVGLCTDICVIANALILRTEFPGTPVTVDASCCAGVTPQRHRNALEAMKMCQIDVTGE